MTSFICANVGTGFEKRNDPKECDFFSLYSGPLKMDTKENQPHYLTGCSIYQSHHWKFSFHLQVKGRKQNRLQLSLNI